ncbi:golgin subfamily A member 4-like [Helianthus annuus]|uniref:golgin subfamily A member 4-like n=1 Tax=Helianthus annuus TaxID=4232 RepID=UPI000B8F9C21|nr:golgin subfamily A member 4-like [Helianthus annuus]
MSFFRYADVFADDIEIDPATADEKFAPEWDIRNKDSVMVDLVARTFIFNISTPLDHIRSRKMKNSDLGVAVLSNQYRRWVEAGSVKENLEKETLSLKRKRQKTPDVEKKLALLSQDLQAQKEKVKTLTTQNQSSRFAAASAAEERDKITSELRSFAESSKKKDEEHKEVLAKMEESISNVRTAYENMIAERDALKTGEADLKARMDEMKNHHKAEIEELKLESADLTKKVQDLQATKAWLLSEGAQLLAKNVHRGPEMTAAVAAVNNAMSPIGVNFGLHQGYVHALKKKTPFAEVPLLNRNAEADLKTAKFLTNI